MTQSALLAGPTTSLRNRYAAWMRDSASCGMIVPRGKREEEAAAPPSAGLKNADSVSGFVAEIAPPAPASPPGLPFGGRT